MHATDQGLVVSGEVDRETPEGKQVWRTIKAGTAGFSNRIHGGRVHSSQERRPHACRDRPARNQRDQHSDASSARALSWKTANQYDMSEFDAMIDSSRKHTAEFRERWRKRLRDHEILEITAKAEREEAKTARADRPIRVKRFEIG